MYCATCKFWKKNITDGGGRCRRYPPQVVARPNGDENTIWPQTSSYDMCGEHKNKDS